MPGRIARVLLVLAGLLTVSIAGAATFHVPGDFATIQAAIDAASSGDEIRIGPGTYDENLVVALGKSLDLIGTAGADATVVDGGRRGSVLRFSGGVVEGLTLRSGQAYEGGGLYLRGDAPITVRNCVIRDNWGHDPEAPIMENGRGGGFFLGPGTGTVTIENNSILDNGAGAMDYPGGGIQDNGRIGDVVIRDNLIRGNGPIAVLLGRATLLRNQIIQTDYGDAVHISSGECRGNTIVGIYESWGIWGGGAVVANNIVVGICTAPVGTFMGGGISGGIPECNDSWITPNGEGTYFNCDTTGRHNISADPLFCGPGDYSISTRSPCFHAAACDLIGALPPACGPTPARPTTWGALKSLYR